MAQFFLIVISVAFVVSAARAGVQFPTDGQLLQSVSSSEIAGQVKIPVKINLKSMVQVRSDRIYLQDLATCEAPTNVCSEIMAIDVDESASPGRTKRVANDRVRHLLDKEFAAYHFEVSGPQIVRVESDFIEVHAKEVEGALLAVLESRIEGLNNLRIRSLNVQMPRAIQAWPGEYNLRFPKVQRAQMQHLDWVVDHLLSDKTWTLIYEPVAASANRSSTHRVSVHLELEMQQPVVRSHVARGSVIKHEHLKYEWIRLGRKSQDAVKEIANIVGLITKQPLRSGQSLSFRMLEVPEVVKRGQKVKMIMKRQGLNVSAEGKALKSGGVGQDIAIYYPVTKKTVQGIILSSGEVEVQL